MEELRFHYSAVSSELESLKLKIETEQQIAQEWEKKASLMATYPELVAPNGVTLIEVEDSVEGQMQAQIKANHIRIDLLTRENNKLQSALGIFI